MCRASPDVLDYPHVSVRRRHITYSESKPPVVNLADSRINTSGSGNTFSGMTFGAEKADRYLVAAFGFSSASDATGCTIGGVAATLLASAQSPLGGTIRTAIFIAPVPSGTSGTVVISHGAGGNTALALYSITGLKSPAAFDIGITNGPQPLILSMAVPASGIAIVCGFSGVATTTAAWTSLTAIDTNSLFATQFLTSSGHFNGPKVSSVLNTTLSFTQTLPTSNRGASCGVSLR